MTIYEKRQHSFHLKHKGLKLKKTEKSDYLQCYPLKILYPKKYNILIGGSITIPSAILNQGLKVLQPRIPSYKGPPIKWFVNILNIMHKFYGFTD
jgi:hypothetical protein